MAKTSSVEKNKRREKMTKQYAAKRAKLKAMAVDDRLSPEERFGARLKLAIPLAILAPIGIHLIFYKLLRVPLPIGLIPMPW